jgi:hypothetical protein
MIRALNPLSKFGLMRPVSGRWTVSRIYNEKNIAQFDGDGDLC